jgi:hypothetical protein
LSSTFSIGKDGEKEISINLVQDEKEKGIDSIRYIVYNVIRSREEILLHTTGKRGVP